MLLNRHIVTSDVSSFFSTGLIMIGQITICRLVMSSGNPTASITAVATDNALSTTLDGESVILHQDSGTYYGLNEVGTFIWDLLQEPHSVDNICSEVVAEYDVTRERCRSDVEKLLADLADKGLVRLDEP